MKNGGLPMNNGSLPMKNADVRCVKIYQTVHWIHEKSRIRLAAGNSSRSQSRSSPGDAQRSAGGQSAVFYG